ncbi:MAG: hypothetical protein RR376_23140 [Janthinobacterium sp.]
MANRETLGLIKGARAGDVACQLALGRLYLFGQGVPRSLPTALHWLTRAAQEDSQEACMLIGTHVPFELAQPAAKVLIPYYEQAFDAGLVQAGLVLAQLVLTDAASHGEPVRAKARLGLEAAAKAGLPDALWLLSRQDGAEARPEQRGSEAWLEQAWQTGDQAGFLTYAMPLAPWPRSRCCCCRAAPRRWRPPAVPKAGSAASWRRTAATGPPSWSWGSAMRAWMPMDAGWRHAMARPISSAPCAG